MEPRSLFRRLIVAVVALGLVHHADHVLRADHAGWPFRPEPTIFTATLLIYPLLALAYAAGSRPWLRAGIVATVAFFTLFAHTLIEPPGQVYGTWARNLSTDAVLYTVDPEHRHNLLGAESPALGALATAVTVALTGLLVLAAAVAVRDAVRHEARGRLAPHQP